MCRYKILASYSGQEIKVLSECQHFIDNSVSKTEGDEHECSVKHQEQSVLKNRKQSGELTGFPSILLI